MRLAPRHPPTSAPSQPEPEREPQDPDPQGCRPRPRPRRRRQPSAEELRRAARAFARRSRAAQGLPAHVQDPEVIANLVMLFRPNPTSDSDQHDHHDRP